MRQKNFSGGDGYDPKLAENSVRPDLLLFDPRFWQIARVIWAVTMSSWTNHPSELKQTSSSDHLRSKARWLTLTLVELGATFIKLGQFLSVRRDILPIELAEELSALQDRVPPFAFDLVRQTIHSQLGVPIEELFATFDCEPIASASIGQVHQATLADGRPVAVKVQRPNLPSLLYKDLGYMRWFAKLALALKLRGDWQGWLELSDQFGHTLFTEIDYIKEGRNADRLRHALRDHEEILIPRVFWKYTSHKVLTLQYLPGTKIDNLIELRGLNLDFNALGKHLINCYMEQVLIHGFFHADPHAGNLAVTAQGKIVIYDFGMVSEISQTQRNTMWGAIAAVVNQDVSALISYLTELGIISATADRQALERTLRPFIDYYSGRSLAELDFSHLEKDIDQIAIARALRLPPTLAYLIRTGVTLEGIARTLKADFSFVEAARPSLRKWLANQPSYPNWLFNLWFGRKGNFR